MPTLKQNKKASGSSINTSKTHKFLAQVQQQQPQQQEDDATVELETHGHMIPNVKIKWLVKTVELS